MVLCVWGGIRGNKNKQTNKDKGSVQVCQIKIGLLVFESIP